MSNDGTNWPANAPPIGSGNNLNYDSNQDSSVGAGNTVQPQPYNSQDHYGSSIGNAGAEGPNYTSDPSIGSAGMIAGRPPSDFPYENAPPIGSGGSYNPNQGNVGNAGEGEEHKHGGFFSNLIKRFT